MKDYTTLKEGCLTPAALQDVPGFCRRFGLEGIEVFMDDVKNRTEVLFAAETEKEALVDRLAAGSVKRIHCSYWAYPTSFLTKHSFSQLEERFGGLTAVREYYGDLTGAHMYARWCQEYELATALGAQSYTFHLIDYAPIDGMWDFTISKADIRQAMISMLQHFLNELLDRGLIGPDSPQIELENAGWGLEHGMQTAEDYAMLYRQIYDPFHKVKLGWDINHLLHALGADAGSGAARFYLPDSEITPEMNRLQAEYGHDPSLFAVKWLEHNILHPDLAGKVGSIHLSDCGLKDTQYFTNGIFTGEYYQNISALKTWEEREEYGVGIVLSKYDNHLVLGTGVLEPVYVKAMIGALAVHSPECVILHELKNSTDLEQNLRRQLDCIA